MNRKIILMFITMITALVFTACGGTEIVDEGMTVETKLVETFESTSDIYLEDDVHKNLLNAIEKSEAQFFYIETDDNWRHYSLYQTDMETFNEKVSVATSAEDSSKIISRGIKHFLNSSYSGMGYDSQKWFHPMSISQEEVYATFGGKSPVEYFEENSIKLNCDEFNIIKMAALIQEPNKKGVTSIDFYIVGNGNVETQEKSCDPYGYFADSGASKNVVCKAICHTSSETNYHDVMRLFIE